MDRLAVVIVTYNSAHCIDVLLDSLPAALAGVPATVVVVDNGSTDLTLERLHARAESILAIANTNTGYAGGINRGMVAVPDHFAYLILNPDVALRPRSIPPLIESLHDEGVGIVVPRVEDANGNLVLSLRRTPTLSRAIGLGWTRLPAFSEYVTRRSDYSTARDADWALGAALAVSRACADAVGPWDESYFLYSEETDYCLRASRADFTTRYEPRSTVVHAAGGSGRSGATHAMQIVNRVRFYARGHSASASYVYLALNVLSEITWLVRGHTESRVSVRALLCPHTRPPELKNSDSLLPR